MPELKTKANNANVPACLAAIEDVQRRQDCQTLIALMSKVTKQEPKMWGTGIAGFGGYHYKYESGHEGNSCLVGLSSRKSDTASTSWVRSRVAKNSWRNRVNTKPPKHVST